MKKATLRFLTVLLLTGSALFGNQSSAQQTKQNWRPNIPKTWADAEMEEIEVPTSRANCFAETNQRGRLLPDT